VSAVPSAPASTNADTSASNKTTDADARADETGNANASPPLAIRRARFTTRWDTVRGARAQAVEVTLANMLPSAAFSFLTSTRNTSAALAITTPHTIELIGPGLTTLSRGVVQRLVPGDQARVDVLVANTNANSAGGGTATVVVRDARGRVVLSSAGWVMAPLVESWTAEKEVLERHETPAWVGLRGMLCLGIDD
jgi:alpha-L-fucosidase